MFSSSLNEDAKAYFFDKFMGGLLEICSEKDFCSTLENSLVYIFNSFNKPLKNYAIAIANFLVNMVQNEIASDKTLNQIIHF